MAITIIISSSKDNNSNNSSNSTYFFLWAYGYGGESKHGSKTKRQGKKTHYRD